MNQSVRSVMSGNVLTTRWSDPLQGAYDRMRSRHIRHLPVTDDNGLVVGVLSDRDLQRAMHVAAPWEAGRDEKAEFDPQFCVRDFMSSEVHSISEKASLKEAAVVMNSLKISSLLVVNQEGVMTGIITLEDLVVVLIGLLNRQPAVVDEFKKLCYNSPLGALANFLNQSGI